MGRLRWGVKGDHMTALESVVDAVNLRVLDLPPNETADLVLIQELDRAGIDQVELGSAYETADGWAWPYCGMVQYGGSGRLALISHSPNHLGD
jgi:hypothetical protein